MQKNHDRFLNDFGILLNTHFDELSSGVQNGNTDSGADAFGRYMRSARLQHNLTPAQLADQLQKDEAYIYGLEHGMIPSYQIEDVFLTRLAALLDEKPAFFVSLLERGIPMSGTASVPSEDIPTCISGDRLFQRHIQRNTQDNLWQTAKTILVECGQRFHALQLKPFHFAPTALAMVVMCLVLFSNDLFSLHTTYTSMTNEPTATAVARSGSPTYSDYAFLNSSYYCATIQPVPLQGYTRPLLVACDEMLTARGFQDRPERRGGPSKA